MKYYEHLKYLLNDANFLPKIRIAVSHEVSHSVSITGFSGQLIWEFYFNLKAAIDLAICIKAENSDARF